MALKCAIDHAAAVTPLTCSRASESLPCWPTSAGELESRIRGVWQNFHASRRAGKAVRR